MKKIACFFLFLMLMLGAKSQIINTVAGNGTAGYSGDGGQATAAEINGSYGVWYYNGNFYIPDWGNHRVRIINSSGVISTFAGNGVSGYTGNGGQATAAEFTLPDYVISDYSDNILIDDPNNHRLRMVNTSGIVTVFAGNGVSGYTGDGGQATAAEFNNTHGAMAVLDDTGNVYIADNNNNVVRKISTSGIVTTIAGNGVAGYSGDGGQATAAELHTPYGVAIDISGNIYIADYSNSRIRKINSSGVISNFAGTGGGAYGGDGGQATAAHINEPSQMVIDEDNNILYFADENNDLIRKINISTGIISLVAGNRTVGFSGDGGEATSAELHGPWGLDLDDDGNLYFADEGNNRIREIHLVLTLSTSETNVSCYGGSTGSASVTASDGTTPYTYSWSGGQTTTSITGLSAGNYTITVTDKYGVTGSDEVTITQPTALGVSASITANVSCNGGSNGSVSSTASGGTSPYSYSWSPGGGTNSNYTGLTAGTYTITLTDNNGCTATASATITQPSTGLSVSAITMANELCYGGNGGSVSASASGGTTPYTYFWFPGGGTNSTFTGLPAGSFTITVTDNNGCTGTASATVTQPAAIAITFSVTNISCGGTGTGSVNTGVSGGVSPYTYSWALGGGTNANRTGLSAGTYSLVVTDNNACTAVASATITQPYVIRDSVVASTCAGYSGATATIGVKYGTSPYTYLWSACGRTTATVSGISSGTYTVNITDNQSCTATMAVGIGGCKVSNYNYAIHYSYDIEGNVSGIVTENRDVKDVKQTFKKTRYYYDLVSGKVNEVIYEHDSTDQFMQAYEYDADNRITNVLTSHDSLFWENDASYEYYAHGPLAREVIGRRQVQGVDYAYTLNGWIKGVNSGVLNPGYDMGGDGYMHGGDNATIGRDAYGFTLNYFNGDYRAIGAASFDVTGLPYTSLYNGNIASATYSIKPLAPKTIGYAYKYDQLNRITEMKAFAGIDTVLRQWGIADSIPSFREKASYDENGNILTYLRRGNTAVGPEAMDSLNYNYYTGTNQLRNVRDAVSASNYPNDIDDEPSKYNYRYNSIGQLAKDSAGGIDSIYWNVYGKVKKIVKFSALGGTYRDSIVFNYDPLGNRLEKITSHANLRSCGFCPAIPTMDTTLYQRDAQGNILAIYDRNKDTVRLDEWDIYGSKRVGTLDTVLRVYPYTTVVPEAPLDSITISYLEGQKRYELTNHLGNVLVTVSDRKWSVDTTGTPNIANYYQPNIINAQDYYPFGMVMPGRTYNISGDSTYRFGFNGMIKDNDVYGVSDFYSTFYRGYDPRLGRWLSIDPKEAVYPSWSPYCFSFDNPINLNDPHGDGPPPTINEIVEYGMNNSPTFANLIKDADIPLDNPNQIIEFQNSNTSPNGPDYRGATRIGTRDPENGCIQIQDQNNMKENVLTITHELTNRSQSKKQNEILKAFYNGEIDAQEYGYQVCVSEIEGQINQLYVCAELGINTGDKPTDNIISQIKNKTISRADVYKAFYGNSKEEYIKNNKKNIDKYAKDVKCLNYRNNKVNHNSSGNKHGSSTKKSNSSSYKSRASF